MKTSVKAQPPSTAAPTANPDDQWDGFYAKRIANDQVYPTEWVVRVLAGGNYPGLKMDKSRYAGRRALDLSCGDGRNLRLLQNLGFEVHGTEVTQAIVDGLTEKEKHMVWGAEFRCGKSDSLPYADGFLDYVISCASCYYLDGDVSFDAVLNEVSRVLAPGGYFIASIPDHENFIAAGATHLPDGSIVVKQDPYGLRNGSRLMLARSADHLRDLLDSRFTDITIGHLADDFFGRHVSAFLFVCRKPSA